MKYIVLISCLIMGISHTEPGCLDMSTHMTTCYDSKTYYLVIRDLGNGETYHCPCPCIEVTADRGRCPECGHFRYFMPLEIVTKNTKPRCVIQQYQPDDPYIEEQHAKLRLLSCKDQVFFKAVQQKDLLSPYRMPH